MYQPDKNRDVAVRAAQQDLEGLIGPRRFYKHRETKELKDEKQKNLKKNCRGFLSAEVEHPFVKNIQQTAVIKVKM